VTLVGPERADAPGGIRPEVGIAIKGPLAMPKRSLDAAAFANWLALRAVEQQTKRLDALESGRDIPSSLMLPERSTATVPAREPLYENPLLTVPRRNVVRTPARPRSAVQPAMPSQAPLEMRAPAATVSPRQAPAAGSSAGAASSVEP